MVTPCTVVQNGVSNRSNDLMFASQLMQANRRAHAW